MLLALLPAMSHTLSSQQAKEAYQRASALEPDDSHLLEALQKADAMERKEAEQRKHKFKRKTALPSSKDSTAPGKKHKASTNLSFADEDEGS